MKVEETDLQKSLGQLGDILRLRAFILAFFVLVVLSCYFVVIVWTHEDMQLFTATSAQRIMNLMVISVTLLIVIIPEGLPIAVSIASSFSTTHLMEDNILIKKL